PLITPVSRDDVLRFKRDSRATAQPWAHSTSAATVLTVLIGAGVAVVFIAVFATSIPMVYATADSGGASSAPFIIVPLLVVAIGAGAAYRASRHRSGRRESLLRRTRFATANHRMYSPGTRNPDYPGLIFSHGDSRQTLDNYYSLTDPRFDIANFRYT